MTHGRAYEVHSRGFEDMFGNKLDRETVRITDDEGAIRDFYISAFTLKETDTMPEQEPLPGNLFENHIKDMLLAYPTLYPNRLSAMIGMFMDTWGYDANGVMVREDPYKPLTREEFIEKAFDQREALEFALRYDNIDLYTDRATYNGSTKELASALLSRIWQTFENWTLFKMPSNVHPDFMDGTVEFMRVLRSHLYQYKSAYGERGQRLFDMVEGFLAEHDNMSKLIAEMLKEKAARNLKV
jgi:hypothetical protein